VAPEPVSSGDRRVGPFNRDTYPSEVSLRPLTLPAGMIRAGGALDVQYFWLGGFVWSTGLGVSGGYGLTDRLELSGAASFGLAPLLEVQRLGLSGTLLVIDGAVLDLAVAVGLDVAPTPIAPTPALSLGFPGRVLLADQLFLTFGAQLLRLQLAPPLPQVGIRLGLGAQLTSSVAAVLETDLLKVLIGRVTGSLLLPLDIGVTAAVTRAFDLRARVQVFNLADPRLAGTFTVAGSAYF